MRQRRLRKWSWVYQLGSVLAHSDIPVLAWLWAAFAMFSVRYKCDGFFFLCEFLCGVCWRFAFVKSSFLLGHANILHLHTWLTRESSVLSAMASNALRNIFWVHLLSLSRYSMTTKFVKWKLRAWVLDYENEVSEEPTVITEWEKLDSVPSVCETTA